MIQANELRIGNFLKANIANEVMQVRWLTIKHIQDGNWQCPPYNMNAIYSPIPLTEEWLLRLGFKKTYSLNYEGRIMALPVIARIFTGGVYIEIGGIYLGDRVKYVHEYQNLHFALTGEELEATP